MLILLVWGRSALQHENGRWNEAETARNPYFIGISRGDPGRIRTCNPRSRKLGARSLMDFPQSSHVIKAMRQGLPGLKRHPSATNGGERAGILWGRHWLSPEPPEYIGKRFVPFCMCERVPSMGLDFHHASAGPASRMELAGQERLRGSGSNTGHGPRSAGSCSLPLWRRAPSPTAELA